MNPEAREVLQIYTVAARNDNIHLRVNELLGCIRFFIIFLTLTLQSTSLHELQQQVWKICICNLSLARQKTACRRKSWETSQCIKMLRIEDRGTGVILTDEITNVPTKFFRILDPQLIEGQRSDQVYSMLKDMGNSLIHFTSS